MRLGTSRDERIDIDVLEGLGALTHLRCINRGSSIGFGRLCVRGSSRTLIGILEGIRAGRDARTARNRDAARVGKHLPRV